MPEKGQTIFAADQVGFSKAKKSDLLVGTPQGLPILERDETYVFIFSDGLRTILVPVNDKVRQDLIHAMRTVPLQVVTAPDNGHN
jgi:hypothetical protein